MPTLSARAAAPLVAGPSRADYGLLMSDLTAELEAAAATLVGFFAQEGTTLDFSIASLSHVDNLLRVARSWTDRQKAMAVQQTGAYLGEVVRRTSPVKVAWVEPPPELSSTVNRACLKSPKGLVFNPLVKPLKFLQATTDEDSLEHFARTARQLLGREAMSFG